MFISFKGKDFFQKENENPYFIDADETMVKKNSLQKLTRKTEIQLIKFKIKKLARKKLIKKENKHENCNVTQVTL